MSKTLRTALAALALTATAHVAAYAQLAQRIAKNAPVNARVNPAMVSLDQRLDSDIPRDATFSDENGRQVRLRDYLGKKPLVLNMIFYKCPGVCVLETDGMAKLFGDKTFGLRAGQDFQAITVSINPKETPALALEKKQSYMELLHLPANFEGWHFLVGAEPEIEKLAAAVGFKYAYDERTEQFAHPAGIILITPEGKVSRYFYSVNYSPRDVRLSLVSASANKIGTLTDRIFGNCIYQYDPKTGRYGLAIMRILQIFGALTVITLFTSIFIMSKVFQRQALRAQDVAAVKAEISGVGQA